MESLSFPPNIDNHHPQNPGITISTLENSIEFYLEYVFIIKEIDIRLFIRNNDSIVMDQAFATEKDARDAFLRLFGGKGWRKDIRPSWSKFFEPDLYWIEFLLSDYKNQSVNF